MKGSCLNWSRTVYHGTGERGGAGAEDLELLEVSTAAPPPEEPWPSQEMLVLQPEGRREGIFLHGLVPGRMVSQCHECLTQSRLAFSGSLIWEGCTSLRTGK